MTLDKHQRTKDEITHVLELLVDTINTYYEHKEPDPNVMLNASLGYIMQVAKASGSEKECLNWFISKIEELR